MECLKNTNKKGDIIMETEKKLPSTIENERNWEAYYQDLNHKFLALCEELDKVQKELKKSQEETKNITKEYNLLKEELQEQLQESAYFRGKAEAYSNSLKYLGNKGWDSISNK